MTQPCARTQRYALGVLVFVAALGSPLAWAQAPGAAAAPSAADQAPPRGPADIIKRAGRARQAQQAQTPLGNPTEGAQLPPGHPPTGAAAGPGAEEPSALPPGHPPVQPSAPSATGALPPGHPDIGAQDTPEQGELPAGHPPIDDADAQPSQGSTPMARRPMSGAQPSKDVPAGSVRVRVIDANDRPVKNANLQLGSMAQNNGRSTRTARTDDNGMHTFTDLPTGDKQAYRVNVLYDGAKYSSTPFRLPTDQGYDVMIRRLETTHNSREVVLYVGATSIELKDDRLKVVQQARLINIGSKTYLFPKEGQLVHLPKDAVAFQADKVMTDQHLAEAKGEGMRISGSLPPGEVTLTWGFDVPREGSTADFSFQLPWVTFAYRVLADAAPGLQMDVDGFSPAEPHEDNGRHFLVTEIVKQVGDTPLRNVRIHLRGIPGPGPMRFIAVAVALVVLGFGVYFARGGGSSGASLAAPRLAHQKEQLLARAAALQSERERGEIGPEYHDNAMREIEDELASVLYEQARARPKAGQPRGSQRSA